MTSPRARLMVTTGGLVCGLLSLALVSSDRLRQSGAPDLSVASFLRAGAEYVKDYQSKLTFILADEIATQNVVTQRPPDPKQPRGRRTKSEVFFVFLAADRQWMAIRDVMEVDGTPAPDRPDLRVQLATLPPERVGATFKAYNSRFNIGRIFRNFNEPTIGLLALTDDFRSIISFNLKKIDRRSDGTIGTLSFQEHGPPTMFHDLLLKPVNSSGDLLIESGTGRVRRTALKATLDGVKIELTTTYAADPKLGMWLPVTFTEFYENGINRGLRADLDSSPYELIVCESKYSNFRRFEVTGRIK